MLKLIHIKKSFGDITPLKDVNAIINKGDVITIIGPSGTGKSTLIRCINRLDDATSGEIIFHEKNIYDENYNIIDVRKKIGMIFQSYTLFNNLNVIENLTVAPINIYKINKDEAYEKARELLKRFSLIDKENNYPHELSGGQKQRVAILRAIMVEPEILLFDEPTSALDPTMVDEVISIINDLNKKGLTMLIVTHDLNFARKVSTRVFYMDEGIVYEEGTPEEIFDNPKKEKTKNFINKINSFNKAIDKASFNLLLFISEFVKYLNNKNVNIKTVNLLSVLIEEITLNEIFSNMKNDDKINVQIYVNNDDIKIIYSELKEFDYGFTNTNELSKKIIDNEVKEKNIDIDNNRIIYSVVTIR